MDPSTSSSPPSPRPTLVIHGGAGPILPRNFPPERQAEYREALRVSLRAGHEILKAGGSAVDAVEAAVVSMEDSPLFNCGKGAVFTKGGKNEHDACLVDGSTGLAGSVTLIHTVRNPIRLAREVLFNSPHFFLGGPHAEAFAKERGLDIVDPSYFWTEYRWRQHIEDDNEELKGDAVSEEDYIYIEKGEDGSPVSTPLAAIGPAYDPHPQGTVGAVALDVHGKIAVATSTGGRNNKWDGRIGDTPILGAGSCAPAGSGIGVSCTGNGEFFIKSSIAHEVYSRTRFLGENLKTASTAVIGELEAGQGGLVGLDTAGNVVMPFNTAGMYRGYVRLGEEPRAFIFPDEDDGL